MLRKGHPSISEPLMCFSKLPILATPIGTKRSESPVHESISSWPDDLDQASDSEQEGCGLVTLIAT